MDNGLHWIGLFQRLIIFPANRETIEFSNAVVNEEVDEYDEYGVFKMPTLYTRTKEGLELKVHFAF